MALIYYQPAFWLSLALVGLAFWWLAVRCRLRWWPAVLLRSALLVLILVAIFYPRGQIERVFAPTREVLLVDVSESVSRQVIESLQSKIQAWQQAEPGRAVLLFGETVVPVISPSEAWPLVPGEATFLVEALDKALGIIGEEPSRIILASDGLIDQPDLASRLQVMVDQGHRLDVIPLLPRQVPDDGQITGLQVPSIYWDNIPIDALFSISPQSSGAQPAFRIVLNSEEILVPIEEVQENLFYVQLPEQKKGVMSLSVYADFPDDPEPRNNSAHAFVRIYESPRVLLVTTRQQTPEVEKFINLLLLHNIAVDVVNPENLSTSVKTLEQYQVVMLHDLLAHEIDFAQMQALDLFVRKFGGGLIFLGGYNSYSLGGYKDTQLEPMLPVKLEPPPRSERLPVIFLMVIDRSGSMGLDEPSRLALASEGAMRAAENLYAEDSLGLMSFGSDVRWDVPLQTMGDGLTLRIVLDTISRVSAGGTTHMYQAMQEALGGLIAIPAETVGNKVMLLLSDGQSSDGLPSEFEELAQRAAENGIVISTIGLGGEAGQELLQKISSITKGRYNMVMSAEALPVIMISEREAATGENIQQGETNLLITEQDHPVLFGMGQSDMGVLTAYNAQSSLVDEGAEDILISASFGDPLLSARQTGLGRVIAWMGDIGEEWLVSWPETDSEGRFWAQVIRYALPNPSREPFQIEVIEEPTRNLIRAWIHDANGNPLNFLKVYFHLTVSDGNIRTKIMSQDGPGSYVVELPELEAGVYRGLIRYEKEEGEWVETVTPIVIHTAQELLPGDRDLGESNLRRWAAVAGGGITSLEQAEEKEPELVSPSQASPQELWWQLILAMLVYWPLEIAIRRRWLPWR